MNALGKGLLIGACGFLFASGGARAADFAFGADLSFLKQAEEIDEPWLAQIEDADNIFPDIDDRYWQRRPAP
jgi:hypothetical protein